MKKIMFFLLFMVFLLDGVMAIRINEVMYNPEGNDNNLEFVEVFLEEEVDLTDYIISDESSNDTLVLLKQSNSSFVLIVEEGFNHTNINSSVYSVGATIGNNLGNDGDVVSIYDVNSSLVDSFSYDDANADGNGYSLEFFDGSWYESIEQKGTPGRENSIRSHKTQDFSDIIISEFFPDPEGNDDGSMPKGEWIELYNKGDKALDLRKLYFKDSKGHKMYISDVTATNTTIEADDCLVVYRNGGAFSLNNEDFEEIELYDWEDNIIDKVDYSDSSEGVSWALVDGVWIGGEPSPGYENPDRDLPQYYFDILDVENLGSNHRAEFGQTVKVTLNAYKGDASKNSMKLWVENEDYRISKVSKLNIYSKFSNYTLTIPVQLYPNCNGKYDEGDYEIYVSWYSPTEIEDSYSIEVKGISDELCDKIYVEKSSRRGTLDYKLLEAPGTIEVGDEFDVVIELTNNDDEDHLVDLASYVYRGSKCYSLDRDANKKSVLVKSDEIKEFDLRDVVNAAESGDYKLKVKIKRDDQKTEKDITKDIKIIDTTIETSLEVIDTGLGIEEEAEGIGLEKNYMDFNLTEVECGSIVYESSNERIKGLILFFIIAFMAILNIFLILKKG